MAVTNQEVILTFNADTGGVETATAKIGKNLEEANKATEGLNDELEDVAKSADKASDATADLAKEAKAWEKRWRLRQMGLRLPSRGRGVTRRVSSAFLPKS